MIRTLSMSLIFLLSVACDSYRTQSLFPGRKKNPPGTQLVPANSSLVLAHSKLQATPGTYRAKIMYAEGEKTVDFTPQGNQSVLSLERLPAGSQKTLVMEIYNGEQLKFIAKKANVSLLASGSNQIIVDDCLVLPAPWDGKSNDGSCDWTIEEIGN